jgi:hypothetical protein
MLSRPAGHGSTPQRPASVPWDAGIVADGRPRWELPTLLHSLPALRGIVPLAWPSAPLRHASRGSTAWPYDPPLSRFASCPGGAVSIGSFKCGRELPISCHVSSRSSIAPFA